MEIFMRELSPIAESSFDSADPIGGNSCITEVAHNALSQWSHVQEGVFSALLCCIAFAT